MADEDVDPSRESLIERMRRLLGSGGDAGMSSMAYLSTGGGVPIRQTQLAPDGLEFCEDVSPGRWVEESLSGFARVHSLLPRGFPAYARVFHPAYQGDAEDQPVRCSTVASWTGRTVHPLMQFPRIADLSDDINDFYRDPSWGSQPQFGSIPDEECRTLVNILRGFTSTPDRCFFGLWEGYGNIDTRRYPPEARVKGRGRDYLLFQGPLEGVMFFLSRGAFPFWGDSPNIWCLQAILDQPDLEALPTSLDARLDVGGDTVNG